MKTEKSYCFFLVWCLFTALHVYYIFNTSNFYILFACFNLETQYALVNV